MHAKAILALLFLVSVAVAGAIFVQALPVGHGASGSSSSQREILVASVPLAAGTLLRMQDVSLRKPPADASYVGEIHAPTEAERKAKPELAEDPRLDVRGAALRADVAAGAPILLGNIVKPADHEFLQVVLSSLSADSRVISIPLPPGSGTLNPGDRVDVILTQTFRGEGPVARRSVSETVAEDLRVLAVEVVGAKAGTPGTPRSIDLEVTPQQAQRVNVANELGKLSLTLRGGGQAGAATAAGANSDGANSGKPVWAGDVSPALAAASAAAVAPPPPPSERPIERVIIRGQGKSQGSIAPLGENSAPEATSPGAILKDIVSPGALLKGIVK